MIWYPKRPRRMWCKKSRGNMRVAWKPKSISSKTPLLPNLILFSTSHALICSAFPRMISPAPLRQVVANRLMERRSAAESRRGQVLSVQSNWSAGAQHTEQAWVSLQSNFSCAGWSPMKYANRATAILVCLSAKSQARGLHAWRICSTKMCIASRCTSASLRLTHSSECPIFRAASRLYIGMQAQNRKPPFFDRLLSWLFKSVTVRHRYRINTSILAEYQQISATRSSP